MSHTLLPQRTVPSDRSRPRRWLSRLAGMAALLAALFGVTLIAAGPASALGYPISYTVRNDTTQTLHFESAHGGGLNCLPGITGLPVCYDKGPSFEGKVSPNTVGPTESFILQSELDIFSFRQEGTIVVTYRIGSSGNDKVVLHTDRHEAKCAVHGTKAYICDRLPIGAGRDFVLRPATNQG